MYQNDVGESGDILTTLTHNDSEIGIIVEGKIYKAEFKDYVNKSIKHINKYYKKFMKLELLNIE